MTNEEILKAAQANAPKEGEAEKSVLQKAFVFGTIICVVLCLIVYIIKAINHKADFVEFSILLLFEGTINYYYGKKCCIRKKTIEGIVELAVGILFFIIFLGVMFK